MILIFFKFSNFNHCNQYFLFNIYNFSIDLYKTILLLYIILKFKIISILIEIVFYKLFYYKKANCTLKLCFNINVFFMF